MTLFTQTITTDADDGRTVADNGGCTSFSSTGGNERLGALDSDDVDRNSFHLFDNVTIPQGATIDDAKGTFEADATNSGTGASTVIAAEDVDDAVAPTTATEFCDLVLTTATVAWTDIEDWTADSLFDTPEIKTIIQEIVNRGSWVSGNSLMIIFTGNATNERKMEMSSGDRGMKLTVNYTVSGANKRRYTFPLIGVG